MNYVQGKPVQREMVPFVPSLLRDGRESLFAVNSVNALLFCEEPLMRLLGFLSGQALSHLW